MSDQSDRKKHKYRLHKHKKGSKKNRDPSTSNSSTTTVSTDDEAGRSGAAGGDYAYGDQYQSEYYDMHNAPLNCPTSDGRRSKKKGDRSIEEQEEYSQRVLQAEAGVHWEKLELICSKTLTRAEMLQALTDGKAGIEFRLGDGMEYGERTCASDFSTAALLDKKGKKLAKPVAGGLDIVKSIELLDIHAPGLDSEKTTINTNVKRFETEGFAGESKFVNTTLLTNQLTNMKQKRVSLLNRFISNHTMIFQAENLGMTPEKMRAGIKPMDDHYSAVDINSPMIGLYNKLHPNAQILEATPGMGDRYRMKTKTAEKYALKTERQMENQISYANITSGDGLVIRFERAIPQSKLEKHQEYVRVAKAGGKPVGEPYLPFASSFNALGRGEEEFKIEFRAIVMYLKGDKEIELGI